MCVARQTRARRSPSFKPLGDISTNLPKVAAMKIAITGGYAMCKSSSLARKFIGLSVPRGFRMEF